MIKWNVQYPEQKIENRTIKALTAINKINPSMSFSDARINLHIDGNDVWLFYSILIEGEVETGESKIKQIYAEFFHDMTDNVMVESLGSEKYKVNFVIGDKNQVDKGDAINSA